MKVKYIHVRKVDTNGYPVATKGGATVAYTVDGNVVHYGIGWCSDKDNFCRRIGRQVASGGLATKPKSFTVKENATNKEIVTALIGSKELFGLMHNYW